MSKFDILGGDSITHALYPVLLELRKYRRGMQKYLKKMRLPLDSNFKKPRSRVVGVGDRRGSPLNLYLSTNSIGFMKELGEGVYRY